MKMPLPTQEFFSIGDVCRLVDLKPHVLRYWESQFRFLSPAKNRSGNRVYRGRDVELVMLLKNLLYTEKYTIEGARSRLEEYRRTGSLRGRATIAMRAQTVAEVSQELTAILAVLDGETPAIEADDQG